VSNLGRDLGLVNLVGLQTPT